jgi:putative transposase
MRSSTRDCRGSRVHRRPSGPVRGRADLPSALRARHADRPEYLLPRRSRPATAAELTDAYATNTLVDLHRADRGVYGVRKLWHAGWRSGFLSAGTRSPDSWVSPGFAVSAAASPTRRPSTGHGRSPAPGPGQAGLDGAELAPAVVGRGLHLLLDDRRVRLRLLRDRRLLRRILGWRVATTKTTPMVTSALQQGAVRPPRRTDARFTSTGLVFHSNAGSQGGFQRSSRHLDEGVRYGEVARPRFVDGAVGRWSAAVARGSGVASGDAVSGTSGAVA